MAKILLAGTQVLANFKAGPKFPKFLLASTKSMLPPQDVISDDDDDDDDKKFVVAEQMVPNGQAEVPLASKIESLRSRAA